MARVTLVLVVLLILLAGVIVLQIILSKRESRWPGLVLPALTFLYSLVMLLNMARFISMVYPVLAALGVFISCNIPTLILLTIYFACRGGRKKRAEMDKMKIEDL